MNDLVLGNYYERPDHRRQVNQTIQFGDIEVKFGDVFFLTFVLLKKVSPLKAF